MALYDKSIILVPCVGTKIFQYQRRKDASLSRKHFFYFAEIPRYIRNYPQWSRTYLPEEEIGEMLLQYSLTYVIKYLATNLCMKYAASETTMVVYGRKKWCALLDAEFRKREFFGCILHNPKKNPEIPSEVRHISFSKAETEQGWIFEEFDYPSVLEIKNHVLS